MLKALNQVLGRAGLARALGYSFGGARDIYETLGYERDLTTEKFYAMFRRNDIAERIVTAHPSATWSGEPTVREDDNREEKTKFEAAWDTLVREQRVYHYLERADNLSRLGQFSLLLLGFSGSGSLETEAPTTPGTKLLYVQPIGQNRATIDQFEADTNDPRFGLPKVYKVKFASANGRGERTELVHWSRVIHISEGLLENDVYGTPVLESIYNRLQDLEKVLGSSAEMYWLNASQRTVFEVDPDAQLTDKDKEKLDEQIENYINKVSRVLKLQGVKANTVDGQVSDPSAHVDKLIEVISGAKGIPKRILVGSERGELASSSDDSNWSSRIGERRTHHAAPNIVRPFIERMIERGVLPEPAQGFEVEWPPIDTLNEKDRAEVASKVSSSIKNYMDSGGEALVTPTEFRERFLQLDPEPEGGFMEPEEEEGEGQQLDSRGAGNV